MSMVLTKKIVLYAGKNLRQTAQIKNFVRVSAMRKTILKESESGWDIKPAKLNLRNLSERKKFLENVLRAEKNLKKIFRMKNFARIIAG